MKITKNSAALGGTAEQTCSEVVQRGMAKMSKEFVEAWAEVLHESID